MATRLLVLVYLISYFWGTLYFLKGSSYHVWGNLEHTLFAIKTSDQLFLHLMHETFCRIHWAIEQPCFSHAAVHVLYPQTTKHRVRNPVLRDCTWLGCAISHLVSGGTNVLSLLLHIERHSWTVSRYFSIMSRLTNYLYTHILAGLCLRIYITLDHYTGRRLYTSHRLLNISSRKLMSFVWPIDSSSSPTSHYAVSRMWLQTFCESIQPATSLFAFYLLSCWGTIQEYMYSNEVQ